MNKIQFIKLLEIRGITDLNGVSMADAVRSSGGDPSTEEMVEVNKLGMVHYIDKFMDEKLEKDNLKAEVERLNNLVEDQEEDVKFLRALEAAGVDNWEGYDIAQDYL